MNQAEEVLRQKKRVTVWGAVINFVLAVVKIVVGLLSQSQSLLADGIHSLSDLATDALVYFAAHHANKEADDDHPYGHGRFETLATVALGMMLAAVAGAIIWDAADRMLHADKLLQPSAWAMGVALLSIAANEGLFQYTHRVAQQTRSKLLAANAWHHRSDAVSSVVVLVGIAGNLAGFIYLDALAAAIVGGMVGYIGLRLMIDASRELVDEALDPERVEVIREIILNVPGVRQSHFLRTRSMGGDALVDVHILVDPYISVSEGHLISERVRQVLIEQVEDVTEVMVHIDPEDDEVACPSARLPLRQHVLHELNQCWADLPERESIKTIYLHYLSGKIRVDVVLPFEVLQNRQRQELVALFQGARTKLKYISDIQILFL